MAGTTGRPAPLLSTRRRSWRSTARATCWSSIPKTMRSAGLTCTREEWRRSPAAAGKAPTVTAARPAPPHSTGRTAQPSPPTVRSISATPTITASARLLGCEFAALDHAQGRVGQRYRAILFDDADAGAHETAVGAALAAPRLDDLAFGMDRVAGEDRVLDIELHVQEGKAGVLHRRLHQQPLGKRINQRRRRQTLFDVGFIREKFEVGEQHLDHAGAVDEIGDVSVGNAAPDRLELPSDRQIFEIESEPHRLHAVLLKPVMPSSIVIPAKAGIQRFQRRSLPSWIPAFAGMTGKIVGLQSTLPEGPE